MSERPLEWGFFRPQRHVSPLSLMSPRVSAVAGCAADVPAPHHPRDSAAAQQTRGALPAPGLRQVPAHFYLRSQVPEHFYLPAPGLRQVPELFYLPAPGLRQVPAHFCPPSQTGTRAFLSTNTRLRQVPALFYPRSRTGTRAFLSTSTQSQTGTRAFLSTHLVSDRYPRISIYGLRQVPEHFYSPAPGLRQVPAHFYLPAPGLRQVPDHFYPSAPGLRQVPDHFYPPAPGLIRSLPPVFHSFPASSTAPLLLLSCSRSQAFSFSHSFIHSLTPSFLLCPLFLPSLSLIHSLNPSLHLVAVKTRNRTTRPSGVYPASPASCARCCPS